MSDDPSPESSRDPSLEPPPDRSRTEAEHRRRRAEVFGEVLPETSADERGETWNEPGPGGAADSTGQKVDPAEEWLRRQVPPHHT